LAEHSERPAGTTKTRDLHTAFAAELPERANRPVWNALRSACLERFSQNDRLIANLQLLKESEPYDLALCHKWLSEFVANIVACNKLVRWIHPLDPLSAEQALESAYQMLQQGMKDQAQRLLKRVGKRPGRGRPVVRRELAIRALELKSSDRTATWRAVAARLCPCGKRTHKGCGERIRLDVIRLKAILRKYSIQIPS